jgi:hypothetical protein
MTAPSLSLPLFYRPCSPIKPNPNPFPACFPLLPPRDTELAAVFLAGICRDRFTPPESPLPTASTPSPLAPRPDPVQPPAFLRRNFSNPRAAPHQSRPRTTSPSTTYFHSFPSQIWYGNHFLTFPWCSCMPYLPMFTGPSPGTPVTRHGRRPSSSPAMFHHRSSSTFPPKQSPRSRRSCPVSPSPLETSPPVRTCRSRSAGRRRGLAGAYVRV